MSGSLDFSLVQRASLFDALRQAAESSGTGLAITDMSGGTPRNLFVSADLARMLGFDPSEMADRDPWSMIAPEELPKLREMGARAAQGEELPRSFETVLLHKSGARIAIELAQSRTMLDGHPITVTFVNDISSRAAASQALRESEKRFRDLVDGAPDGVAILRGPVVMFLNARAAKLLGVTSAAQGIGRVITDFLHPEDRERAAARIRKLLQTGGLDERAEYRSIDERGEEHTVEISSIPIEYQGGPAVLAFARDVTERKRMEIKLLEADRLTALGVLSAGVAHEINNPLAYVLLNLEYLKRELPKVTSDPSRIESLMVRVQDACHGADRVASIVRDLRTFARVDGHLLRVSVAGEGPPVLLIMGLGGNIEMWAPLERELHDRGFQTIAYDASGTGHSPPRLVPLRPHGLARQAAHLLDQLGLPQVDVLGVSFGGGVAQELAVRNPHRVRRLVLASTACGIGSVPGTPVALGLLATPLRYYSPRFLQATARRMYGPVIDPDGRFMHHQMHTRRARPPTVWGYASQLYATAGWTSLPWLHRIGAPTLILTGDKDPIVPPINARILGARIPHSTVHVIPGAGHLLLMDRAVESADLITRFLRSDEPHPPS